MTPVIAAARAGREDAGVQTAAPREGGLRSSWPLLAGGFAILFCVVGGGVDTAGVFMNALSTHEGWSRRGLSLGVSVGALGAGLFTPLAGVLVDRFGARAPIAAGVVVLAGGYGVLASMREPWHFVAANVLLGPGFALAMLPITVAVTLSVRESKALALGIVGVGSSAGALVLAPVVQALVGALGWRGAYVVLGALVVGAPILPLVFALPRGPLHDAAQGPRPRLVLGRELRRPGVGALVAILVLPGLAGFGVNVHLVPLLTDAGHTPAFAAAALGAAIGISALGKLAGGFLGDHLGPLQTVRLALATRVLALCLLPLAAARVAVGGFAASWGLAVGAQIAVIPVVAFAVLGERHFATLFGVLQLAATLAVALGPLVPGLIVDATGSYSGAIVFWIAALAGAVAVAFRLRIPEAVSDTARAPALAPRPG
jgi:MFS family permease